MSRQSTNAQRALDLDRALDTGETSHLVDAATLDVAQLLRDDAAATDAVPNAEHGRARLLESIVELQQAEGARTRRRAGRSAGHARRLAMYCCGALAAFGSTAALAAQTDSGAGNAVRGATRVAARVLNLPQPAPTASPKPPATPPRAGGGDGQSAPPRGDRSSDDGGAAATTSAPQTSQPGETPRREPGVVRPDDELQGPEPLEPRPPAGTEGQPPPKQPAPVPPAQPRPDPRPPVQPPPGGQPRPPVQPQPGVPGPGPAPQPPNPGGGPVPPPGGAPPPQQPAPVPPQQ